MPEAHLCCGSAGTYNILQPDIARALRDRKVANIERTGADVIATGNIGCMTQIAPATGIPVVHTVELLDWANGGPVPDGLDACECRANDSRQIAKRDVECAQSRRGLRRMAVASDRAEP